MKNKGFVATTVNPFGDIENQVACFNSWKKAGYQIKTFNAKKEADALLQNGFLSNDIVVLDDSETTYLKNKKYLPKVKSILERVVLNDHDIIIVNSDIFALHSVSLINVFKSISPSLAVTRREVLSLSTIDLRDNEFYRGGLDLFFFSSQSLKQLINELEYCEAADNMAFGVPGWDYLIGALIEKKLNGKIFDGSIVSHKYHKNTYPALDNFDIYARDIAKLLSLEKADPYWVANEYAHRICEQCKVNMQTSISLQSFFYLNRAKILSELNEMPEIPLIDIDNLLSKAVIKKLNVLVNKVTVEKDWGLATLFIPGCFTQTSLMTASLFTLLNCIMQFENEKIVEEYPPNSLHWKAMSNISSSDESEKIFQVLDLFSSELIGSRIFNFRLYDFLILSCTNNTQLKILKEIKSCLGVN